MNFLENTASLIIPILAFMIVYYIAVIILHQFAKYYYKVSCCRKLGVYLYPKTVECIPAFYKLFFEGSLELSLAISLQIKMIQINKES